MRLRRIQHLTHETMDEMNLREEQRQYEELRVVIDNFSQAIDDLAHPFREYSLDYIEQKLESAHYLLFKNPKEIHVHL